MIRKQVYLTREHERKLKALAGRRGCREAEIIREALDRLLDAEQDVAVQLAVVGLLAPKGDDLDVPRGAAARALDAQVESWLASRPTGLGLSDAVLEGRAGR